MTDEPEPECAAAERAIVEETPVEALASDSATIAVVEETAATACDGDERWPRLPRSASSPRASPPAEPREYVFVSGASVVLPPCPVPLTVRGTQALVSFAPLAFKLFYAARQNAVPENLIVITSCCTVK